MNKTWVNSSSTARARPRRERGAQGASVQRPPEREDRLVDPPQGYSASGGDERWRQQSQRRQMYEQYGARSSVSEEEFGDPASISPASGQERQLQRYIVRPSHVFAPFNMHLQPRSILRPTSQAFTSTKVEKW